jgi:protein SCO1/2
MKRIRWGLWGLVLLSAAGLAVLLSTSPRTPRPTGVTMSEIGGPFRLLTAAGTTFTQENVRGRPYLVFFGFTHCPDVCPTALMDLTALYEALGRDADKLTTLFITVDPERDTQAVLADYMEAFDPRFVALRGDLEQTQAVARAFKANYRKVPQTDGGYSMDHTATVYVMDRSGRFVNSLDPHESEATKLGKLRRVIAE